jgi:hypothetical protein
MRLPSSLKVLALFPVLLAPLSLPAFAGAAEEALLARYAGNWRGTGEVKGPDPGSVVCRLSFKPTESGALSYSGRCSFGAGGYSFRGAMAYDDSKGRFFSQSTVQGEQVNTTGKRSGNTITFASSMETRYGDASSSFSLAGNSIKLSFKVVDKKGRAMTSSINFSKQ